MGCDSRRPGVPLCLSSSDTKLRLACGLITSSLGGTKISPRRGLWGCCAHAAEGLPAGRNGAGGGEEEGPEALTPPRARGVGDFPGGGCSSQAVLRRSSLGLAGKAPKPWRYPPSCQSLEGLGRAWPSLKCLSCTKPNDLGLDREGYVRLGSHLVKNSSPADSSPQDRLQEMGAQMDQGRARLGNSPLLLAPRDPLRG